MRALIIAEAGISHCGRVDYALELCDAAKSAGADVVKFQTWTPGVVPSDLNDFWFGKEKWREIARHCEAIGIEFCSTPDDVASLHFLVESCGVKRIKIGSGSLLYRPLIDAAFQTGLPVLLSTGMAGYGEVLTVAHRWPQWAHLTLMHCVSLYPCTSELANMRRMETLKRINARVGFSDHTLGYGAAVLAVGMGAQAIEKHLMLPGITCADEEVSVLPDGFRQYVDAIRLAEKMMGNGNCGPSDAERAMIPKLRKTADGVQPGVTA